MQAEILLTLKLQQKLFADPRRIALLKQVQHTGSISQGAKLAGISYKSAWDAINEMNQLAEHTVVDRATGGKGGGGAQLTHYGQRLIQLYDLLGQVQQKAFDVLQQDDLPLDSLLAAISRFSLQTSARNQFFGTVIERDHQQVQQHLAILLNDGTTRLTAAITQQSADRLQLVPGKEVLALIKAPWVRLSIELTVVIALMIGIEEYATVGQQPGDVAVQRQLLLRHQPVQRRAGHRRLRRGAGQRGKTGRIRQIGLQNADPIAILRQCAARHRQQQRIEIDGGYPGLRKALQNAQAQRSRATG